MQYIEALIRYPVQFSQSNSLSEIQSYRLHWKEGEKEIIALGIWGNK